MPNPNNSPAIRPGSTRPSFLFDLDGTLVDSVYPHVLAWREAMRGVGMKLDVWRIHRRMGMSGGLMVNAIIRETGHTVTADEARRLLGLNPEAFARLSDEIQPLGGARELLAFLTRAKAPWTIAPSARHDSAMPTLDAL